MSTGRFALNLFAFSIFCMAWGCTSSKNDKAQKPQEELSQTKSTGEGIDPLKLAISNPFREAKNIKRDKYRHPYETLSFFDVQPHMNVVEITPSQGWYTEILGPFLKEQGSLSLAIFSEDSEKTYAKKANEALKNKIEKNKEAYGDVKFTAFEIPNAINDLAKKDSVDRILTFRNLHNWVSAGKAKEVFEKFYQALKPGGILGVVDHRASKSLKDPNHESGYVKQDKAIEMAEEIGFKLIGVSEINANASDTTKHPKGVWTLPPSLALGDKDKGKYLSIGESDRMTLKFMKPEN